jgi:hypothetical protein
MQTETQKITITIDKKEALSIYNALLPNINPGSGCDTPETKGASDLKRLLQGNFFSDKKGIHML